MQGEARDGRTLDLAPEDGTRRNERSNRRPLVGRHEGRITRHVGRQDGREALLGCACLTPLEG